jgi:hypothetical protein
MAPRRRKDGGGDRDALGVIASTPPTVADTPTITPTPVIPARRPHGDRHAAAHAAASGPPTASPTLTPLPWLPRIRSDLQPRPPSCSATTSHGVGSLVLTADEVCPPRQRRADSAVARNRGLLPSSPTNRRRASDRQVTQPPLGEGSKMPLTGTPLGEQIALLTGWIEAGAPQD